MDEEEAEAEGVAEAEDVDEEGAEEGPRRKRVLNRNFRRCSPFEGRISQPPWYRQPINMTGKP